MTVEQARAELAAATAELERQTNYWKNPVKYLLKTLAALSAYFLLAWALPKEQWTLNDRIVQVPSLFAQPFAGMAVFLFVKTMLSVFAELCLWRIMTRPLANTSGEGQPTPARGPGIGKVKRTDGADPQKGLDENG